MFTQLSNLVLEAMPDVSVQPPEQMKYASEPATVQPMELLQAMLANIVEIDERIRSQESSAVQRSEIARLENISAVLLQVSQILRPIQNTFIDRPLHRERIQ
jgi:hypothetical protein